VLERSFEELMKTYVNFFGRDGSINMWARSICYRLWIAGGFPISFMLNGWLAARSRLGPPALLGLDAPVPRPRGFLSQ
jgi:hypothetical protein